MLLLSFRSFKNAVEKLTLRIISPGRQIEEFNIQRDLVEIEKDLEPLLSFDLTMVVISIRFHSQKKRRSLIVSISQPMASNTWEHGPSMVHVLSPIGKPTQIRSLAHDVQHFTANDSWPTMIISSTSTCSCFACVGNGTVWTNGRVNFPSGALIPKPNQIYDDRAAPRNAIQTSSPK